MTASRNLVETQKTMPEIPVLKTKRLHLRAARIEDAPAIQKYFNNFEIIKYIGNDIPWPYPENGAETFLNDMLEKMKTQEIYLWAITLLEDPEHCIGLIEYRFTDKSDNRGFWLAEPFHAQGLMSEAVATTQDFIFFELGKDRIIVRNAKSNKGSRKVKIKNGAELVGRTPCAYLSGDTQDEIWQITKQRWAEIRKNQIGAVL